MKQAMKVIITRPSPDAEAFAREVSALGCEAIVSPAMAIRARGAAVDLGGAGSLAFTSSNGVRAFAAASPVRALPVYAVGAATAAAARGAGFANVAAATGDVESLVALITQAKPSAPVLHLAGSERAGDVVAALVRNGVPARRAVLYDAVEIDHLSEPARAALSSTGEFPAIVLFSPRSARLFLRQAAKAGVLPALANATALCLSDDIASAAADAAWGEVRVAADRTSDAMLRLVAETFAGRKGRICDPR